MGHLHLHPAARHHLLRQLHAPDEKGHGHSRDGYINLRR